MKLYAIHLFVLLLLALVLCSTLGTYLRENMTSGEYTAQKKQSAISGDNASRKLGVEDSTQYFPKNVQPENPFDPPQAHISSNGYKSSLGESDIDYGQPSSVKKTPVGPVLATHKNTIQGVPRSNIPDGQEDLYILKSQVVPPVCPACPTMNACPRQEAPPPCPPCARCPEPAFECKKIPNYRTNDDRYLPRPILADFSQFGM